MSPPRTLILGGVRSGKSRLAERLAAATGLPVTYVATATAQDAEMQARIAAHRARRPAAWRVVEEPVRLAAVLQECAAADRCTVVDCLTLWLTNLLCTDDPAGLEDGLQRERAALLAVLPRLPGPIILVGNETNMGIVPVDALARRYCDEAGLLHQALAQQCERVILTVAGLPLIVKGAPL